MYNSRKPHLLMLVIFCLTFCLSCDPGAEMAAYPSSTGGIYNIKDFGAKGDGVTDDSQAIQNAADKARDNKGSLLVPPGNYLLENVVRVYTSINCQGKFFIKNGNNKASIDVVRWTDSAQIPPGTLKGLTRGSTQLAGLNGFAGGTVVLKSTEILIERKYWGSDYTKNEISEITGSDGMISPALDCTYNDLSRLTIGVYKYQEPIVISGLNVESIGDVTGSNILVACNRNNVTFENPVIVNTSQTGSAGCGLNIFDCVNVTVNNPVISNFQPWGGDGYGIGLGCTANIKIFNGNITACSNHAVTGRHDKNVLIHGGVYEGNISALDNHWGNNFRVEDAVLTGEIGISYAGTDISIRNCTLKDCAEILTVRTDTPSLRGRVIMDGLTASVKKGLKTIYCYRAANAESAVPDMVSVTNILADVPQDGFLYYYNINVANQADYSGRMTFDKIQTVGGVGTIITGY